MRRIAFFLLTFLWAGQALLPAQRLDEDLQNLAFLPMDSSRVAALNRISEALQGDYPDSAMTVAAQAMSLARKVNFSAGQTQARLNQGRALVGKGRYDDAAAALKICESEFAQLHDLSGLAACALADGQMALQQKAWNAALAASHKADSLMQLDSLLGHGPDLLRGNVFQELGNYDLAAGFYETAQRIANRNGASRGRAAAAEALGALMLLQGRNDSAMVQYRAAFEAWKAAGDRLGQMTAFTGMGTASARAGKPEGALDYLRDAITLAREDRAPQKQGLALIRLAEAEVKLGLPDSAQRRCYDALALLRNLPDPVPALDARIGIVQAALIRADYNRAQRHGDTAIAIADSFKLFRPLYTVNQLLSKAYQVLGDYRQALRHFQLAATAKDSLQRIKERNQSLAVQVRLTDEADFKGRQESQQTQAAAQQLAGDLQRTKIFLWLALGALIVSMIGGTLFMLRARASGRRIKQLLLKKDEELGESQQELSRVSARLHANDIDYDAVVAERTETLQEAVESLISENEGHQEFLQRGASDLLQPVGRLKELVRGAKGSGQVKDFVLSIDLIEAEAIYMERMLQKLLKVQEIKNGFRELQPVNIEELILDIRPQLKEIPGVKYPDVRFEDHLKRPVLVDGNLIRVILENLLENACLFRKDLGNDSPLIEVMLKKEDEDIFISIRDEGIGIPNEVRDKIFDLFFKGSAQSQGHGLGLYLVQRALREIGGRIAVESKEGVFTEFIVRFHEMEG
jgi:signal transduction histidine kinase